MVNKQVGSITGRDFEEVNGYAITFYQYAPKDRRGGGEGHL
jgi:hypothetical protein